ncbi:hypothetical protein IQ06DRAFT_68527 [Phaeosphaeriaceae sp. SRC1lsM3a]|nr:hypothetical protein IQ06DRAFT_68527 [Stagonospora sp. SRC1lsM3a]
MRFSASILLASLTTMASAAPTSLATNILSKRENRCENSTFENASSGGSPQIADCEQLARNIEGSGNWNLGCSQRTIATYGTCAFGAEGKYCFAHVGNEDVRDLIRDSIAKFSWEGKVGARGDMTCGGTAVNWGLYHT